MAEKLRLDVTDQNGEDKTLELKSSDIGFVRLLQESIQRRTLKFALVLAVVASFITSAGLSFMGFGSYFETLMILMMGGLNPLIQPLKIIILVLGIYTIIRGVIPFPHADLLHIATAEGLYKVKTSDDLESVFKKIKGRLEDSTDSVTISGQVDEPTYRSGYEIVLIPDNIEEVLHSRGTEIGLRKIVKIAILFTILTTVLEAIVSTVTRSLHVAPLIITMVLSFVVGTILLYMFLRGARTPEEIELVFPGTVISRQEEGRTLKVSEKDARDLLEQLQ